VEKGRAGEETGARKGGRFLGRDPGGLSCTGSSWQHQLKEFNFLANGRKLGTGTGTKSLRAGPQGAGDRLAQSRGTSQALRTLGTPQQLHGAGRYLFRWINPRLCQCRIRGSIAGVYQGELAE
jgi:hypothetical protein